MIKSQQGQSTAEYAVVISVVIAVIVGMQLYVKRGIQSKFKHVADSYSQRGITDPLLVKGHHNRQYEPYYNAESDYAISTTNTLNEKMTPGGVITKTAMNEKTTRSGTSKSGADVTKDDTWK